MLATMVKRPSLPSPVLLAVALAAGCTPAVRIAGDWQPGADRGQAFRRLVVVGVSPHYGQRCAFEYALASSLRGDGVQATASCATMSSSDVITREAIEAIVKANGADAVVATLLVANSAGAREGGGNDKQGGGYYKPVGYGFDYGYYGMYGVPVVYGEFQTAPSLTSVQGAVTLDSNVYETRGATVVYGLETRAVRLESRGQALAEIAPAIADRLRGAGVVR